MVLKGPAFGCRFALLLPHPLGSFWVLSTSFFFFCVPLEGTIYSSSLFDLEHHNKPPSAQLFYWAGVEGGACVKSGALAGSNWRERTPRGATSVCCSKLVWGFLYQQMLHSSLLGIPTHTGVGVAQTPVRGLERIAIS